MFGLKLNNIILKMDKPYLEFDINNGSLFHYNNDRSPFFKGRIIGVGMVNFKNPQCIIPKGTKEFAYIEKLITLDKISEGRVKVFMAKDNFLEYNIIPPDPNPIERRIENLKKQIGLISDEILKLEKDIKSQL